MLAFTAFLREYFVFGKQRASDLMIYPVQDFTESHISNATLKLAVISCHFLGYTTVSLQGYYFN